MFIGNFGVALAAKRIAPRTSLALLVLAAQFLDLIWPIFLLLGLEHVRVVPGITRVQPFDFYDYPFSHSFDHGVALGARPRPGLCPGTSLRARSMGSGRAGRQPLGAGFHRASSRPAAMAGRAEGWTGFVELVARIDLGRSAALWH